MDLIIMACHLTIIVVAASIRVGSFQRCFERIPNNSILVSLVEGLLGMIQHGLVTGGHSVGIGYKLHWNQVFISRCGKEDSSAHLNCPAAILHRLCQSDPSSLSCRQLAVSQLEHPYSTLVFFIFRPSYPSMNFIIENFISPDSVLTFEENSTQMSKLVNESIFLGCIVRLVALGEGICYTKKVKLQCTGILQLESPACCGPGIYHGRVSKVKSFVLDQPSPRVPPTPVTGFAHGADSD